MRFRSLSLSAAREIHRNCMTASATVASASSGTSTAMRSFRLCGWENPFTKRIVTYRSCRCHEEANFTTLDFTFVTLILQP